MLRQLPQQSRNVDRNCRQEGEKFCIFLCNVCSLVPISARPFLFHARLLSRRIALVSLRLFSSISGFRSASDPAGTQVLVVRRRMLLASRSFGPLPQSLPSPSISMSPPSFALLSSPLPLLLYLNTSQDNVGRRWHSRVQEPFVRVRRNP